MMKCACSSSVITKVGLATGQAGSVLGAALVASGAGGHAVRLSTGAPQGRWVRTQIAAFELDYTTGGVAINDRGNILGTVGDRAILWTKSRVRDLGVPVDWWYGAGPNALNSRGDVVGAAIGPTHEVGEEVDIRAFLWRDGKLLSLGSLENGDRYVTAYGINDRGHVVGMSGGRGSDPMDDEPTGRAFLWIDGKMRALATPPGTSSAAVAINEHDAIVGWILTPGATRRAVVWRQGRLTVLPTLGGASAAVDVNNRGQILGWSKTRRGAWHAVLWEGGRLRDLGTRIEARAINDEGLVVGACGGNACALERGRLTDLGKVGDAAVAVDVNDRRQILGNVLENCGGGCSPMYEVYVWTWRPR